MIKRRVEKTVVEGAVICEKKKAGGVLVKPATGYNLSGRSMRSSTILSFF